MENQVRTNDGKPKLSYFFANRAALHTCAKYFDGEVAKFLIEETQGRSDFLLAGVIANLSVYLGAGPGAQKRGLVAAFVDAVLLLEFELAGGLGHVVTDRELVGFLCSTLHAVDEYCALCVWGEATKYVRGNYRLGAPVTEYCDCALRHVRAYGRGTKLDPESGRPHLGHVIWNLWQALDQPSDRDDRLARVQTAYDVLRDGEGLQMVTLDRDDPDFEAKLTEVITQITGARPATDDASAPTPAPPSNTVN